MEKEITKKEIQQFCDHLYKVIVEWDIMPPTVGSKGVSVMKAAMIACEKCGKEKGYQP